SSDSIDAAVTRGLYEGIISIQRKRDEVIGRTLAHYRITSAIGSGGMGEGYRAADTKLGRDIALKVLPAGGAGEPAPLRPCPPRALPARGRGARGARSSRDRQRLLGRGSRRNSLPDHAARRGREPRHGPRAGRTAAFALLRDRRAPGRGAVGGPRTGNRASRLE